MYMQSGLGAAVQQGAAIVTPVAAAAAKGAVASTLGISAGLAVPIIGAAIAGVAIGIEAILHSGCGQSCVETSEWANKAAALLDQNLAAYFGLPIPRTRSNQAAALQNFDAVWQKLYADCSAVPGRAGSNCIADRQAGACKWKALAPAYPGQPAAGSCWNWFNSYRDPIANDPNVVSDAAGTLQNVSGDIASAFGGGAASGSSWLPWLAGGAVVFLVVRSLGKAN
jgi:hypothetical protein